MTPVKPLELVGTILYTDITRPYNTYVIYGINVTYIIILTYNIFVEMCNTIYTCGRILSK